MIPINAPCRSRTSVAVATALSIWPNSCNRMLVVVSAKSNGSIDMRRSYRMKRADVKTADNSPGGGLIARGRATPPPHLVRHVNLVILFCAISPILRGCQSRRCRAVNGSPVDGWPKVNAPMRAVGLRVRVGSRGRSSTENEGCDWEYLPHDDQHGGEDNDARHRVPDAIDHSTFGIERL